MSENPSPSDTIWVRDLEMLEAPSVDRSPRPAPTNLRVRLEMPPDLELYCRLYRQVGDPWTWFGRRRLAPAALLAVLSHESHELWILEECGRVRGMAELDYRASPVVELAYFGLTPDSIGRGLGRWFMTELLTRVWAKPQPVSRLWLHTCELDHPGAVDFYQRSGFRLCGESRDRRPDPRETYCW